MNNYAYYGDFYMFFVPVFGIPSRAPLPEFPDGFRGLESAVVGDAVSRVGLTINVLCQIPIRLIEDPDQLDL